MTEADWLASSDPMAMWRLVTENPDHANINCASDRKLRLFACAYSRLYGAHHKSAHILAEHANVLARAEAWADSGIKPTPISYDVMWHVMDDTALRAATNLIEQARRCGHEKEAAALLRCIVGNPFRPPPAVRAFGGLMRVDWLTPTVVGLAQAAYEERRPDGTLDPERLAVLADALEEAGCDNVDVLAHLRGFEPCRDCMLPTPEEAEYGGGGGTYWCPGCGGTEAGNPDAYWMLSPGPHVRGCWAVDLCLGKE